MRPSTRSIDSLSCSVDLIAEQTRGFAGVLAENNSARRTDHQPSPFRIQTGSNYGIHISPLCPYSRNQERDIWCDGANRAHLLRVGSANHQHAVAVTVPVTVHLLGNYLPERITAHAEVLKLSRAGIGGAAKNDARFIRPLKKRSKRLTSEVGMQSHSVKTHLIEYRSYISAICISNIGAFGIADSDHLRMVRSQIIHGHPQLIPPLHAACFIECRIRLHRCCILRGLVDN